MSSWGCPHEIDGVCQRVRGARCDPGMLGCVVQGKVETLGEPRGPRRPVRARGDTDDLRRGDDQAGGRSSR